MCALSNAIREKNNWWVKIKHPTIVGKWRAEALEQQRDVPEHLKITEAMVCTFLSAPESIAQFWTD
jgi:hypothetical protein